MFQSDRVDLRERFEILRKAISGTMSKFYMARDRKTDKIVGLKIADREKWTAFEARFKGLQKPSEGEIASTLHHPLVVETYEYGMTNDGLQYIVMEFVKGPGLHQLLYNRDSCLEAHRLRLVRQMAEALEYVHEQKYIHRDVCPRNFIYESETGTIKLIDFGLSLPARPEFMQPGNRTGTPLYMAPEVVRRRSTDHRLDIFAMGVSAYQICTYELPWPVLETTGQAALAHDTQQPRDILEFHPALNRTLAKAIMRCMRPNPNDRPATVTEFLRAIRGVEQDDE
ncbi:MAG: serine/threonine protein kinase [Pirellulaceae bacterium]